MSKVRSRDTAPEMAVRRMAHAMGYRYRLHVPGLPGRPDLVFPRLKAVVFVHGCFWHRHHGCRKATVPATRTDFWLAKLTRNVERDRANLSLLKAAGWRVLVVWECQLKGDLRRRLARFLES